MYTDTVLRVPLAAFRNHNSVQPMRSSVNSGLSGPDHDVPPDESGGSFRRVLVPIDPLVSSGMDALALAIRIGTTTGGSLRVVFLRMWDPPVPRGGRFYSQTSEQATAFLDSTLTMVWDRGVEASGVVVDVERSKIASAIVRESSAWCADVIVLTAQSRRAFNVALWDRVSRQVMHKSACPVLIAHPSRR